MSDETLVKYLLGECNADEKALVAEWLSSNEENVAYFAQFQCIWDESKSLSVSAEVNVDEAWMRLKNKMVKPKLSSSRNQFFYYAAACVLLLVGIFSILNYWRKDAADVAKPIVVSLPNIIESKSETRIDTLSDKSVVTLNKNAVLKCPKEFSGNERRVKLQGEAFFSISPNKEKPFFIEANNDVEIRVVGTSFNVKSFDAYTEVIVETGIVEVRKFNKVVLLHPREKARIRNKDSSIVVEKNKDKLYKYYRSREFECDNTPLWKVVEVLNEVYGDSILIGRSELKGLTLTTRFDNESLESILEIISETFEIKVEKKGNKYILK